MGVGKENVFTMVAWVVALFLQAGTAVESASFLEDVKRLLEESASSSVAGFASEKSSLRRAELRKLVEMDPSFVKVSRMLSGLFLDTGWLFIELMIILVKRAGSPVESPFPSENLALVEIASAYPYARMLLSEIANDGLSCLQRLRVLCPFLVAAVWYILSLCNALQGWTLLFSTTRYFLWIYISVLLCFVILSLSGFFFDWKRANRIRRFLNSEEENFQGQVFEWRPLSFARRFLTILLVVSLFIASADHDKADQAVFDITATAAYLLILGAEGIWEDLVLARAQSTATAIPT